MTLHAFVLSTPVYEPARVPLALDEPYGYETLIPRYRHFYENSYLLSDQDEILVVTHTFSSARQCRIKLLDLAHNVVLLDASVANKNGSFFLNLDLTRFEMKGAQKLRLDLTVHDENSILLLQQINARLQDSVEVVSTAHENFISISLKQLVDYPILYEQRPRSGKYPDFEAFGMSQMDVITRAFKRLDRVALAVIEPRTSFYEPLKKYRIEFAGKSQQQLYQAALNSFCEITLQNTKRLNWIGEMAPEGVKYVDFVDSKLIVFCYKRGSYQLKWVDAELYDGTRATLIGTTISVE